jgi:hypothetical protein
MASQALPGANSRKVVPGAPEAFQIAFEGSHLKKFTL